jgi:hypothetical protein
MRRRITRILVTTSVLFAIVGLASWWAVGKTREVPEFYRRATANRQPLTQKAARQFEKKIEKLHSDTSQIGSWHSSFDADEINQWLADELPKKFPRLLAIGAQEPRVVIEEGRVLAAVRYQRKSIDIVISCRLEVEMTEHPNMLALRVTDLRAGALRLPLGSFIKGISKEAAHGDIDIQWDNTEKDPVALVTVPSEHPQYIVSPVVVESVRLDNGTLTLSGHCGPLAQQLYSPIGNVYRFVSYQQRVTDTRNASNESESTKIR